MNVEMTGFTLYAVQEAYGSARNISIYESVRGSGGKANMITFLYI